MAAAAVAYVLLAAAAVGFAGFGAEVSKQRLLRAMQFSTAAMGLALLCLIVSVAMLDLLAALWALAVVFCYRTSVVAQRRWTRAIDR